ncbi:MAG: WbqC family protein [Eggerthellaceae bacterium]|nr:WbqC family protein [Eggerthellaceae bacterium]
MKKIAILQSNYIPWKGYFDIINYVDEFIIYDNVQYTRNDWRNRNRIKTPNGVQWLTIPVFSKSKFGQNINETKVSNAKWATKHMKTLHQMYAKAPHFKEYESLLEDLYNRASNMELLSEINYMFMTAICNELGIDTKLTWSTDYEMVDGQTERLIGLIQAAGGDYYLSGPAAKNYINEALFDEAGIKLDYIDYSGYPEYEQLYGDFDHAVSVLDLLFMTGPEAPKYMKSFL